MTLLTLLSPSKSFVQTADCQQPLNGVKAFYEPVLASPDNPKSFKLEMDASAVVAGAAFIKDAASGVVRTALLFSKLNRHQ